VGADEAVAARKRLARLGRLLAASDGYQVRTKEGAKLGRVEYVRYKLHADRPDEIIVRPPGLLRPGRRAYPLSAIHDVIPREQLVVITSSADTIHSLDLPRLSS
jgi:hypothetical protein